MKSVLLATKLKVRTLHSCQLQWTDGCIVCDRCTVVKRALSQENTPFTSIKRAACAQIEGLVHSTTRGEAIVGAAAGALPDTGLAGQSSATRAVFWDLGPSDAFVFGVSRLAAIKFTK